MKKVLITGGAGFIGSNIAEALHETHEVIVLDNLRTGFERNLNGLKVRFVKGDVCNLDLVQDLCTDVDTIFHLSALISVPESMTNEIETVRINVMGTLNVLRAARDKGVKNLVLSSSAAVYGDNPTMPKHEHLLPEPKSPYAITKLDGEYYFRMYRKEYGLNAVSLRYFNVFGPRQDPKSQYAAAIPIFVYKAIKNEDVEIFGDGEQTRDFIYVKDVVRANRLVVEKGGDVFNVARGNMISINELAQKIISIVGSSSKIVYAPSRPGDIKYSRADISRISDLGFKPETTLDEGLKKTIEYFISIMK